MLLQTTSIHVSLRSYHIIAPVHQFKLAPRKPGPHYLLIGHFQRKPWFAKPTSRTGLFLHKLRLKTEVTSGRQQADFDQVCPSSKWSDCRVGKKLKSAFSFLFSLFQSRKVYCRSFRGNRKTEGLNAFNLSVLDCETTQITDATDYWGPSRSLN